MQSNDRHRVYKSLETDGEFRVRVEKMHGCYLYATGDALDEKAWDWFQMQRRIVERTTDPTSR